jgi:hypothetical protein
MERRDGVDVLKILGKVKARRLWVAGLSAVAALLAGAVSPAYAGASQTATTSQASFWYTISSGESFTQAAHQAAQNSSAVVPAIERMVQQVKSGKTVTVPEGTRNGVTDVHATESSLQAALNSARSVPAHTANTTAQAATAPQDFEVMGFGCNPLSNGDASWCEMPFELDGGFCDGDTCENTDRITGRLTVDPANKTSRASYNLTYVHQATTRFTNIHFQWWTLCYRGLEECGTANTRNLNGNSHGTFNPTSNVKLSRGSKVTHAFSLWARFTPTARYYNSNAKTGTATCSPTAPESPNECLYPAVI